MESTASVHGSDPVTFGSPPLNEVAMSVQFPTGVVDEVDALARYWPTIRDAFPLHDKQPPLFPVVEDFNRPPEGGAVGQLIQGIPPARYWFLSEDKTWLVQVQADRFVLNWRRVEGGEEYPRYRALRPEFERRFRTFLDIAGGPGDAPAADWCELSYINHVAAATTDGGEHGPLSRVLRVLSPDPASETLPPVEDTQLQQRFVISWPGESEPMGRLYLNATPAFSQTDGAPIYVVALLVRGRPRDPSVDGVLAFFDLARELIVRGFKESTTPEMHTQWRLQT